MKLFNLNCFGGQRPTFPQNRDLHPVSVNKKGNFNNTKKAFDAKTSDIERAASNIKRNIAIFRKSNDSAWKFLGTCNKKVIEEQYERKIDHTDVVIYR
jgi:hypothetical protein